MPPTSSPNLIGDRYRLETVLGRGGMGEVRAATDLRLDRRVAVKLLRTDLSEQDDLRIRFEREARAAARISHPNVVAVFDTGEYHGVPYIVMERLPGDTLANELAAGRFSQAQACSLIREVLSALDAAHRLGVLHRDIKPGNILRGHDGEAKVADFGIAKVAEDPDPATTGIVFGTAAYLAPERLAGDPATPASDLYSVGVVLFEALAGRPPFQAETPLGLVQSISGASPPSLGKLRPDVHPAVVAVTARAMAKDPRQRFESASAMAAALRLAAETTGPVDDQPTVPVAAARSARTAPDRSPNASTEVLPQHAPPAGAGARPRRDRHVAEWVAGAIALVAAIVILLAVFASGTDDPGPSQPASPSQTSRTRAIPEPLRRAIDQLDQAVQP